jgi:DNA-binding PadR family transcriptional regulator
VKEMTQAKRKLSNPLALAVLVLLYERPMHPYEMAATLRERHKEDSIKLRYGSLYTVINLLVQAGFIVARHTTREGNRPEKTIYNLTTTGETELRHWMRDILSTPIKEFPQFEAGLSLLPALPPQEAADVLATRVACLKHDIEQIKQGLQAAKAQGLPALFAIESEYHLTQLEAEYTYVEHLIARIRTDGCGYLQEWQQWHTERAPQKEGT